MSRKALGIIIALFMLCVSHAVDGQEMNNKITSPASAPVITGTASAERLRFTAPSSIAQMQLQIYAESGQLLFDVTSRGNVLDWTLQEHGRQHLVPGSYLCVVTVKSLSGKLTQRIGAALVEEKQVGLQRAEPMQLTLAQQQAVGPIEENGALTILNAEETQAATVLANNGTDGQMIRGRGALSFRIGDFFSGKDKEQMRLTEEGNLGLGTSTPQAKLDVAGTIRAERFVVVKPNLGNGDKTAAATQASDAADSIQPLVAGTGTLNRLAKWLETGGAGTLGDSGVTEVAGNVGIGTTSPAQRLAVNYSTSNAFPGISVSETNASASTGLTVNNTDTSGNSGILFNVGDTNKGRIKVDNAGLMTLSGSGFGNNLTINSAGKVGIGTTSPAQRLAINYSTSNAFPGISVSETNASASTGLTVNNTDTSGNSGILFNVGDTNKGRIKVDNAGLMTLSGSGFGNNLTINSAGNVGIGTNSPGSKLDVAGDINTTTGFTIGGNRVLSNGGIRNLFAGVGAGQNNPGGDNAFFGNQSGLSMTNGFGNSFFGTVSGTASTGNLNSFFGRGAGIQTSGQTNSFFGADTGFTNTSGSNNTLIGYGADVGANNLTNATAIGTNSQVTQSNSLVLGSINGTNGATSDTKVGIGTSAPVNVLHLNGNHNDFALTFTNQSNTSGRRGYRIAFDSDRLTFQSANDSGAFAANQMTIDPPTGNVGIGTTAPSFKLHINDPSNTGLRVQNNASGGTVAGFGGFGDFQIDTITTAGGRFTVKENGNTGIGTNNPNAKLQVVGGNVYIANPNGLILSSPNGTCWQIGVSNAGALTTIPFTCP